MTKHVAILGGGVAGLSAAHELAHADPGATITVHERNHAMGGKARSFAKSGTGVMAGHALPAEHGFRFFPGYYRHVVHTMSQIPFGPPGEGRTVADNLVDAPETHMARLDGPVISMPNHFPTNLRELVDVFTFNQAVDIPRKEIAHFAMRIGQFLVAGDERRFNSFEKISWLDFVDGARMGKAYNDYLADGLNQRTVAASGDNVSARTVGTTLVRIMTDWINPGKSIDRVLDGPTSERWLDPWRAHLEGLGVVFDADCTLERLIWDHDDGITSAQVTRGGGVDVITADAYIVALPVADATKVFEVSKLTTADVGLGGVTQLTDDWMNGIQFYLDGVLDLAPGHTVYVDSDFSLTSISQLQFWQDPPLDPAGPVRSVLSVDISDWETECRCHGRRAKDMTIKQVRDHVWRQLQDHIEPSYGTSLPDRLDWCLDPAITQLSSAKAKPRLRNAEGLFINRVDSWKLRPRAVTGLENLFLAADYVQTVTDLATMEAANEAARHASRGVLRLLGGDRDHVELFDFPEPADFVKLRRIDDAIYKGEAPQPPGEDGSIDRFADGFFTAPPPGPTDHEPRMPAMPTSWTSALV